MNPVRLLLILSVAMAVARGQALTPERIAELRARIRRDLFIPDPLPDLDARVQRHFTPAPGVSAEAVTYATQFGTRVPAILYLPDPLPAGRLPALVIVNGHGGDKYSWYAYYAGILYARAGGLVLTYDVTGEGERNIDGKSNTRAHDNVKGDEELGRRMNGFMLTDIMQGVSYLQSRPEVDPSRVGVCGFSMGSLLVVEQGAIDGRARVSVLVGGGNITVGPGHWDTGHMMCQGWAYQSLHFLGDRPAVIYALQAARGPTLIWNGCNDTVVGIPQYPPSFFQEMHDRAAATLGSAQNVFAFGFNPIGGHRPYFLTKPVALWLQQQLRFPNWSEEAIRAMPESHVNEWGRANGVPVEGGSIAEAKEGGILALGNDVPGYPRDELSVFTPAEFASVKTPYLLETWVAAARAAEQAETR
jgi:dienelactone hydrolase